MYFKKNKVIEKILSEFIDIQLIIIDLILCKTGNNILMPFT